MTIEKNPLAVTGFLRGKTKKRILPVSCYLIEHPKGKYLILANDDPSVKEQVIEL